MHSQGGGSKRRDEINMHISSIKPNTSSVIALLLSLCFAALSLNPCLANEQIVRLGSFSKAVDYAPYLVAKQKHYFEDALKPLNARPTYEEFQSLPAINEAFASKRLDGVFEAEAPCIVGKAAGIDLKIVAVSAVVDVPVIVHKDSHIEKLSDLRGKKVAVLAGTSAHYVLLKLLESARLSKNDVAIMNMVPPDAKSAFDSKKIDAWAIWPPFSEQEEISGGATAIPKASGKVVVVMVARADFLKEQPKVAKAIIDVVNSTRAWVKTHPQESQKIVAVELKLPLAVVQKAWLRQDWQTDMDAALERDIQSKADFLKSVGFVRKQVDAKTLILSTTPAK